MHTDNCGSLAFGRSCNGDRPIWREAVATVPSLVLASLNLVIPLPDRANHRNPLLRSIDVRARRLLQNCVRYRRSLELERPTKDIQATGKPDSVAAQPCVGRQPRSVYRSLNQSQVPHLQRIRPVQTSQSRTRDPDSSMIVVWDAGTALEAAWA